MSAKYNSHHFDVDEYCVHDEVMKHLQKDKISMRPRIHFIIGSVLVGVGIAGTIISSVFFTHVIVYRIRAEQVWGYVGFGAHGLLAFVQFFPWPALIIALAGLFGGTYLLKQYDFGCKHRLTRVLIASCALIFSFGVLLEYLDFGDKMIQYSAVENMYRQSAPIQVVSGTIKEVRMRRLVLQSPTRGVIKLDSSLIEKAIVLKSGMSIQALGRWERDVFHIQRIRVISVK